MLAEVKFRFGSRILPIAIMFLAMSWAGAQTTVAAQVGTLGCEATGGTAYRVSLNNRAAHIVRVQIAFRGEKGREFQLPVWNALCQIRDFAQYVRSISAAGPEGKLDVTKVDKTTWRVEASPGCATLTYEIYANEAGPFGAQLNEEHAFFNWARVLMYPTDGKKGKFRVEIADVPSGWRAQDGGLMLPGESRIVADSYDRLVDSPVELGNFASADFEQAGGKYRVVVHADPLDYDLKSITTMLEKVVGTTVDWMGDMPFERYTFIYHFPRGPAGGGMEHANSTAIDSQAERVVANATALASVSAHEFFHAWNVKRLRPQSLEPIDYTKENYTRALWFSEGVTSTVSDHMLYRAGLIDEKEFLHRLALEIGILNARPARRTQSVEESSLDTWFDKYSYYREPERSINYYNKGQIVGELLDLRMRSLSGGTKSLRDLFHWMNQEYAKKGQFFPDSDGVQLAAETLTEESFDEFFENYVAGTAEIPYDEFFAFVGLRPIERTVTAPALGFHVPRSFSGKAEVTSVEPGSEAAKAGIGAGDVILMMDGAKVGADIRTMLKGKKPGDTVKLRVKSKGSEREIKLTLGSTMTTEYLFVDTENVSAEQRRHREAWLRLESEKTGSDD